MDRIQLKTDAKNIIKRNWLETLIAFSLPLVATALALFTENGFLVTLSYLMELLIPATAFMALLLIHNKRFTLETLMDNISENFLRYIGTILLQSLYIFFWSVLFLIPGIIKTYSYAAVPYILAKNPKMGYNEAITLSRKLMNGHKADLLILQASFIPWLLLVGFTFGAASVYVLPYLQTTQMLFFDETFKDAVEPNDSVFNDPEPVEDTVVEPVEDAVEDTVTEPIIDNSEDFESTKKELDTDELPNTEQNKDI